MGLDTAKLITDLLEAFDSESDKDVNPAEARVRQATKIGNAIDAFVKGGTVKTTVTGTAVGNVVTGTGTGKVE